MCSWTWTTRWFAARAVSVSQFLQSFSTSVSFTLREQFFTAGVQAERSMPAAARRSSASLTASQVSSRSPTSLLMTRPRLSGRVASRCTRRVAVVAHSMITLQRSVALIMHPPGTESTSCHSFIRRGRIRSYEPVNPLASPLHAWRESPSRAPPFLRPRPHGLFSRAPPPGRRDPLPRPGAPAPAPSPKSPATA